MYITNKTIKIPLHGVFSYGKRRSLQGRRRADAHKCTGACCADRRATARSGENCGAWSHRRKVRGRNRGRPDRWRRRISHDTRNGSGRPCPGGGGDNWIVTMLMLSRLYNYSLDKYFAPLTESILQEDSSSEVSFALQVGNGDTIQIMADTI